GFVLKKREDSSLLHACFLLLAGAPCGLFHEERDEDGDDGAGYGGDDERPAPTVVFADSASDEIAERGTDGEGDVEDGKDAVALVLGIEVREYGGGEDAKAGFADPEGGVAKVERVVGVNTGGEEVDAAPEEGGDDDHGLAWKAVAEPAGDGRRAH